MLNTSAYANEADSIITIERQQKAFEGVLYLNNLVNAFSNRYVVSEATDAEFSEIEKFYDELSTPLTLEEIDGGNLKFDFDKVMSHELKSKIKMFKTLGGLSGYKARFVPVKAYNIYRHITVVGGFTVYDKTHTDPYEAYWQCVCAIEGLTKEIVNYNARMKLVESVRKLNETIDNDHSFTIFILVDGKINSVWEK